MFGIFISQIILCKTVVTLSLHLVLIWAALFASSIPKAQIYDPREGISLLNHPFHSSKSHSFLTLMSKCTNKQQIYINHRKTLHHLHNSSKAVYFTCELVMKFRVHNISESKSTTLISAFNQTSTHPALISNTPFHVCKMCNYLLQQSGQNDVDSWPHCISYTLMYM